MSPDTGGTKCLDMMKIDGECSTLVACRGNNLKALSYNPQPVSGLTVIL